VVHDGTIDLERARHLGLAAENVHEAGGAIHG
jgi:hypothetical protein